MSMRAHLPPGGDVPPVTAARRLFLTLAQFEARLPDLLARGFPPADPTTGNYDLDAIDAWRRSRNPHLFRLTDQGRALHARDVVSERVARLRGG